MGLRLRAISVGPLPVGSIVGLGGCEACAGEVGCDPGFGAIGGLTPCALGPSLIPECMQGFGGTGGGTCTLYVGVTVGCLVGDP